MNFEGTIVVLRSACPIDSMETIYLEELAEAYSGLGNYTDEAVQKEKLRLFYSGTRLSLNSNNEISLTNPRLFGQPLN